jgi:hypothetical protein
MTVDVSKERIEEIKAKYPKARRLTSGDVEIIVRPPNRAEWKRSMSAAREDRAEELEQLLFAVTLEPDRETMKSLIAEFPGLPQEFGDVIAEMAGAAQKAHSEPL